MMNRLSIASMAITLSAASIAAVQPKESTPEQKAERMAWWRHDRFGMFIHFGLYSVAARHEWVKSYEYIPDGEYDSKYFSRFDPDLLDAKAWVAAAKRAGMKYVVLTTKHHEGFCLWDTKTTDYKSTNTPFGRDIVREFVDTCREAGLKVGFYFSLMDWHHPDYTVDIGHPRRPKDKRDWTEENFARLNAGKDMDRYRQFMKDQVGELLSNYGRIDIVWFDFTYPKDGGHGKTAEDWDSEGLLKYARSLQPWIIVDNRLGLTDTADGWDFVTPEQFKVEKWPTVKGERVPWEVCQTFSGSWGYARDEMTWKGVDEVVALLVHTVSKGGNLIMNVGPTARGRFDARASSRLRDVGEWMKLNSRAIYGCTEAPKKFVAPANTILTYNPTSNRLYIHLLAYPGTRLACPFAEDVVYAQFLHDASEIGIERHGEDWAHKQNFYESGCEAVSYLRLPAVRPDVLVPVIEVILKDK